MDAPFVNNLNKAFRTLLRPLVKVLLRNGVAYGTFAEMVKKTYADVAWEEFAEPGRKPTVSRVSVLTGLTRKEASRLLELSSDDDGSAGLRYNRAVRMISGWLNDPEFSDAQGQPAVLDIDQGNASFAELTRRYSGDMPVQAILRVLESAGSVSVEDKKVRLMQNAFIPSNDPMDRMHILGTDVKELISTIDHNLQSEKQDRRFQRKVSSTQLPKNDIEAFKKICAEKAQTLLEELDEWLSGHEVDGKDSNTKGVSVGIYFYEE